MNVVELIGPFYTDYERFVCNLALIKVLYRTQYLRVYIELHAKHQSYMLQLWLHCKFVGTTFRPHSGQTTRATSIIIAPQWALLRIMWPYLVDEVLASCYFYNMPFVLSHPLLLKFEQNSPKIVSFLLNVKSPNPSEILVHVAEFRYIYIYTCTYHHSNLNWLGHNSLQRPLDFLSASWIHLHP